MFQKTVQLTLKQSALPGQDDGYSTPSSVRRKGVESCLVSFVHPNFKNLLTLGSQWHI